MSNSMNKDLGVMIDQAPVINLATLLNSASNASSNGMSEGKKTLNGRGTPYLDQSPSNMTHKNVNVPQFPTANAKKGEMDSSQFSFMQSSQGNTFIVKPADRSRDINTGTRPGPRWADDSPTYSNTSPLLPNLQTTFKLPEVQMKWF